MPSVPLATLSSPRGMAHPCVYRGFCAYGCSTNAKQSVLVTFVPRAIHAGAEIRDLAMVGKIELGKDGRKRFKVRVDVGNDTVSHTAEDAGASRCV